MAPREEVNDIVQNFVDNDLASLDRIGDESTSFSLSPHLAQTSPDLSTEQPATTSKQGPEIKSPRREDETAGGSPGAGADPGFNAENESARPTTGSTAASPSTTIASGSDQRRTSNISRPRHVSQSSAMSVSTVEKEKRGSLGDKFKKFGRRITSGSKK